MQDIIQSVLQKIAKAFNFCRFNKILVESSVPESNGLIAVMDASFSAKSGKKTFGLDWFYRGCYSRPQTLFPSAFSVHTSSFPPPLHSSFNILNYPVTR
jgi:hypothetical protein